MSVLDRRYYEGETWAERFQVDLLEDIAPHIESEGFSQWLSGEGRPHLERCIVAYVDWLEWKEQNP